MNFKLQAFMLGLAVLLLVLGFVDYFSGDPTRASATMLAAAGIGLLVAGAGGTGEIGEGHAKAVRIVGALALTVAVVLLVLALLP